MPLTRRYSPEHSPGDSCLYGIDMSLVLPPGAFISLGSVAVLSNTFVPTPAPEWAVGPVQIQGSVIFARLSGGTEGSDYQIRWNVQDSDGNVWNRTALVLCSLTS